MISSSQIDPITFENISGKEGKGEGFLKIIFFKGGSSSERGWTLRMMIY